MALMNKMQKSATEEEVTNMARAYLHAIDEAARSLDPPIFEAALVDGRFRLASALRLLSHTTSESVVIVHDFWGRFHMYNPMLQYYNLLSYTRTLLVLRRKSDVDLPKGWQDVYKDHMHEFW